MIVYRSFFLGVGWKDFEILLGLVNGCWVCLPTVMSLCSVAVADFEIALKNLHWQLRENNLC